METWNSDFHPSSVRHRALVSFSSAIKCTTSLAPSVKGLHTHQSPHSKFPVLMSLPEFWVWFGDHFMGYDSSFYMSMWLNLTSPRSLVGYYLGVSILWEDLHLISQCELVLSHLCRPQRDRNTRLPLTICLEHCRTHSRICTATVLDWTWSL